MRHDNRALIFGLLIEKFQSTCLREARLPDPCLLPNDSNFNPRAYVRHDVVTGSRAEMQYDFNPRAYVRHDLLRMSVVYDLVISIHVPT